MTRLEELSQQLYDKGITIHDFRLDGTEKAITLCLNGVAAILIDRQLIESDNEEADHLAEALERHTNGYHYRFAVDLNTPKAQLNRMKGT